jgi:formyltetrahydrofolate hydrolase
MSTDRAEISGVGQDQTGLIAKITSLLFERESTWRTSNKQSGMGSYG